MDKTSSDDKEVKLTSGMSSERLSSSTSSGIVIWRGTAVSASAALDFLRVMTQFHPEATDNVVLKGNEVLTSAQWNHVIAIT